jgi:hypothetical protein
MVPCMAPSCGLERGGEHVDINQGHVRRGGRRAASAPLWALMLLVSSCGDDDGAQHDAMGIDADDDGPVDALGTDGQNELDARLLDAPEQDGTPDAARDIALDGFLPALSFVRLGEQSVTTFPSPLMVSLSSAPSVDTFVVVDSSDPQALIVSGGGVAVPAGMSSVPVLVTALQPSESVTLTATLGVTLQSQVRVLDGSELPSLASLTPVSSTIPAGGTVTLTVELDIPAAGGANIDLSLNPTGAGSMPLSLTIAPDQLAASFDYVDGSGQLAQISATLGANTYIASVAVE